jgi:c(7)-type cytochrome triheme protein
MRQAPSLKEARMRKSIVMIVLAMGLCAASGASADKVGGGDVTFRPKQALPVVFSHDLHVNGSNMKCARCHYSIFQMMQGDSGVTMDEIKAGNFCGKCHDGKLAFNANEGEKNCGRCHKETPM